MSPQAMTSSPGVLTRFLLFLSVFITLISFSSSSNVLMVSAATSGPMEAALSGSTFFWQVLLQAMSNSSSLNTAVTNALTTDLQNAAGSTVTVALSSTAVNESAFFLTYTFTPNTGSSTTEAEVAANVLGSNFAQTTTLIQSNKGSAFASISDIVPNSITSITPLYINPNADSSSTTYTGSVVYDVLVLFTGEPSSWDISLSRNSNSIRTAVRQAVSATSNSRRLVCNPSVTSMRVLPKSYAHTEMGNGDGGLLVGVESFCSSTAAMTGRFLYTDEYLSLLQNLNTTSLTTVFQSTSGSSSNVSVEETAVTTAATTSVFTCDATCKGMIAMGAVLAGLILLTAIITVVLICTRRCGVGAKDAGILSEENSGGYAANEETMQEPVQGQEPADEVSGVQRPTHSPTDYEPYKPHSEPIYR